MSAPGHQATAPPGWYPDPDGAAGMVRWWDGAAWSDVATPAGPGLAVGSVPGAATDRPPTGPVPTPEFPAPARSIPRPPWAVGLALLLVAVVVLAGVLLVRTGDAPPAAAPPSDPARTQPAPPTFPPGTVRIVDEAAGLSYPHLGTGWFEYDLRPKAETLATAGQYFVTQPDPPSGGVYVAECTSGPVADAFAGAGGGLRDVALALAASHRVRYYPQPNEQRVLRDESREVDGHPAHLMEVQLSWEAPGYAATGERLALLVVDVGRERPALVTLSIPNTHAELYGVVDEVLAGVEVA